MWNNIIKNQILFSINFDNLKLVVNEFVFLKCEIVNNDISIFEIIL